MNLRGYLYDDSGAPISGATVQLYNAGTTTLVASTTTNASGEWSFTGLAEALYDAKIINGTQVRWIKGLKRDSFSEVYIVSLSADTATIDTLNVSAVNKTGTTVVTNWNSDMVDGKHAGNSAGQVLVLDASGLVPLGNRPNVLTGKDADTVDGAHAGNSANQVLKLDGSGLVPLGNIPGTLTGKSADMVDGLHVSDLDERYVNVGEANSISSGMIQNGAVGRDALATGTITGLTYQTGSVVDAESSRNLIYSTSYTPTYSGKVLMLFHWFSEAEYSGNGLELWINGSKVYETGMGGTGTAWQVYGWAVTANTQYNIEFWQTGGHAVGRNRGGIIRLYLIWFP